MMTYKKAKYNPFIVTQIRELQNEFILAESELSTKKQSFSNKLYQYVDYLEPQTCCRIFVYESDVYLSYFWLSDLREPGSGRAGIYFIVGMSCPYSIFQRNPLELSEHFLALLSTIQNVFEPLNERELLATNIINTLWKAENIDEYVKKIYNTWKNNILNNTVIVPNIVKRTQCSKVTPSDTVGVLSHRDFRKYIHIFTFVAANNMKCFFKPRDYADVARYGNMHINILFGGESISAEVLMSGVDIICDKHETIIFVEMITDSNL